MARPLKQGLDYFPLDVGFLQNLKVRKIIKAQGVKSIPVLICLLSNIYREDGYYLRWDGDTPFLIAEESGAEEGVVAAVLSKAQQVDFFDAGIFETYRVLTSEGIQKRYFLAIKSTKRKEISVVKNFLLVDPSEVPKNAVWYDAITMPKNGNLSLKRVSSGGNSIIDGVNPINSVNNTQRKVKESKEKEIEREREIESRKEKREKQEETTALDIPPTTISQSVLDVYWREMNPPHPNFGRQKLECLVRDYGDAAVIKAIERAVVRGKNNLGYAEAILRKWAINGYDEEGVTNRPKENPQIAMAKQAIEMLRGENTE